MKKLLFIIGVIFGLTACGSTNNANPLSYNKQPILNVESPLAPLIEVNTSFSQARIKNISDNTITINYHFFWYNKNGVSREENDKQSNNLILKKYQTVQLPLYPPTEDSVNYRLYLRLK